MKHFAIRAGDKPRFETAGEAGAAPALGTTIGKGPPVPPPPPERVKSRI